MWFSVVHPRGVRTFNHIRKAASLSSGEGLNHILSRTCVVLSMWFAPSSALPSAPCWASLRSYVVRMWFCLE